MKLLLLIILLTATPSVLAFSSVADDNKSKAADYSICSIYFLYVDDKDKEKFFYDNGPKFVGRARDSKHRRLRKWKN